MNKYGIEHFHIEKIEECDDSVANAREVYWIKYYNSYYDGYNATYGGEGRIEYDGDEFYSLYLSGMRIKDIAKEKHCDHGTVSKCLQARGIDTSKDLEKRNRDLYGKKCQGIKGDIIIEFDSMMDAARYIIDQKLSVDTLGGIQTHIGQVCNGKRKTAYGYKWKYI